MPPITDTIIFKNHPSTFLHSDVIDKYLTDELDAHRMSGPFSHLQVENILHGTFFCSPLLVSVQTQQPGTPDKLRVCRHLSKGDKNTPSTNSHIHKEDFPTRFDTALKVADIVGIFPTTRKTFPPMSLTSGGLMFFHGDPPLVAPFFMRIHLWWPLVMGIHLWWPHSS